MGATDEGATDYVAREIERYLAEHPQAADTLEGVLDWWIWRQRLQVGGEQVRQALERLVAEGKVDCSTGPDGRMVFSRSAPNRERG